MIVLTLKICIKSKLHILRPFLNLVSIISLFYKLILKKILSCQVYIQLDNEMIEHRSKYGSICGNQSRKSYGSNMWEPISLSLLLRKMVILFLFFHII